MFCDMALLRCFPAAAPKPHQGAVDANEAHVAELEARRLQLRPQRRRLFERGQRCAHCRRAADRGQHVDGHLRTWARRVTLADRAHKEEA